VDRSARRVLLLLSIAELLAMSLWFTGTAVLPQLTLQWGSGIAVTSWLTIAVQLGFVAGALAAAHRIKLDVPRNLSIVGFDDTPLASSVWPAMTTIRQPVNKLTRRALELLVEDIRRRRSGRPALQHQEVVNLSLVKRKSATRIGR